QREARLVDLLQDVVHRVANRAGDRAVDGRGGGLVREGAGIGDDAPGGDRAVPERPQETLVPAIATIVGLDVGQRARDPLVGVVHRVVEHRAVLRYEAVLLLPDIQGGRLERDVVDR